MWERVCCSFILTDGSIIGINWEVVGQCACNYICGRDKAAVGGWRQLQEMRCAKHEALPVFDSNDVVLAKTNGGPPYPAYVEYFGGYVREPDLNQDEEFYRVVFIKELPDSGEEWANVYNYQLTPLTFAHIAFLRAKYSALRKYLRSLNLAQRRLEKERQSLAGDMLDRFERIYLNEAPIMPEFLKSVAELKEKIKENRRNPISNYASFSHEPAQPMTASSVLPSSPAAVPVSTRRKERPKKEKKAKKCVFWRSVSVCIVVETSNGEMTVRSNFNNLIYGCYTQELSEMEAVEPVAAAEPADADEPSLSNHAPVPFLQVDQGIYQDETDDSCYAQKDMNLTLEKDASLTLEKHHNHFLEKETSVSTLKSEEEVKSQQQMDIEPELENKSLQDFKKPLKTEKQQPKKAFKLVFGDKEKSFSREKSLRIAKSLKVEGYSSHEVAKTKLRELQRYIQASLNQSIDECDQSTQSQSPEDQAQFLKSYSLPNAQAQLSTAFEAILSEERNLRTMMETINNFYLFLQGKVQPILKARLLGKIQNWAQLLPVLQVILGSFGMAIERVSVKMEQSKSVEPWTDMLVKSMQSNWLRFEEAVGWLQSPRQ